MAPCGSVSPDQWTGLDYGIELWIDSWSGRKCGEILCTYDDATFTRLYTLPTFRIDLERAVKYPMACDVIHSLHSDGLTSSSTVRTYGVNRAPPRTAHRDKFAYSPSSVASQATLYRIARKEARCLRWR